MPGSFASFAISVLMGAGYCIFFDERYHIGRQLCTKFTRCLRGRMAQRDVVSVQRVTRKQKFLHHFLCYTLLDELQIPRVVGSINLVAHDRMTDRGHVNSQLMRAARARRESDDG